MAPKNKITLEKRGFLLIAVLFALNSCWAPRCPVDTCHVKMEHRHSALVSGVFSGKYLYPPRIHTFFDGNKGENNPDTKFSPTGTSKRKLKKKFPWERW